VLEALEKLADDCKNSKENCTTFHRLGGVGTVVGVMLKWVSVPAIQSSGCKALLISNTGCREISKCVIDSRALDAICWAMETYPNDFKLQFCGVGALLVFSHLKENAEYIVTDLKKGGVIVAAMKSFPKHAELQRIACGVLDVVAQHEELRGAIVQADGRQALLDAIQGHPDETNEIMPNLQKCAREALKKLLQFAKESPTAQRIVVLLRLHF